MPTRRSARVRTASARQKDAEVQQNENSGAQAVKPRARKTASGAEKNTVTVENVQRQTLQPLRDVTNVPNTRARRTRRPVENSGRGNDAGIKSTSPHSRTRQRDQPQRHSETSDEIRPADKPSGTTRNAETQEASSDEIQPNPPKVILRPVTPTQESSLDEIRPNMITRRQGGFSRPTDRSDEAQPRPARNVRSLFELAEQSETIHANPKQSDASQPSPVSPQAKSGTNRNVWSDENRDPNTETFEAKRPRQAVHTYGKRRRMARVSLPTMKALGVRAKSPSSGSQSASEKGDDGEASAEYQESDQESEDTPKRDPKLQAFIAEQRKLWQEVDETDLLVESD